MDSHANGNICMAHVFRFLTAFLHVKMLGLHLLDGVWMGVQGAILREISSCIYMYGNAYGDLLVRFLYLVSRWGSRSEIGRSSRCSTPSSFWQLAWWPKRASHGRHRRRGISFTSCRMGMVRRLRRWRATMRLLSGRGQTRVRRLLKLLLAIDWYVHEHAKKSTLNNHPHTSLTRK